MPRPEIRTTIRDLLDGKPVGRRGFLIGAGAAGITGAAILTGCDSPSHRRNTGAPNDHDPKPPPVDNNLRILNPEVKIWPKPQGNESNNGPTDKTNLTPEQMQRLKAPVFTLTHTVSDGETMNDLVSRYYDKALVDDGVALRAIKAANTNERIPNPDNIYAGDKLYIPITEPVIERFNGPDPIGQAAEKYRFNPDAIRKLNVGGDPGIVYLPKQASPQLKDQESLYVVKGEDKTYFSIAQKKGYNLATLLGRNRPDASALQLGHILIVKPESEAPKVETPNTTIPDTVPTTRPATSPPTIDVKDVDAKIKQLEKDRNYPNGVYDQSERAAALEQDITIERLKKVQPTPEGYGKFLKTINRDFAGAFEDADTTRHPYQIIDHPDYFIIHHTAYGYREGLAGVQQFIQSVVNESLSVQWLIDGDGTPYQLVRKPKVACNQAYGVNQYSTGVEIMTNDSKAQGSITEKQLTSALYLAYYVTTQIYGRNKSELDSVVVGHREIDDRKGQNDGKPDFFKSAMDPFRDKLDDFAKQMK
ncbi:MAG TPA: N-acetylmuramoyl-L-alanine amidase [Candidatus Saccharimonadales bacterium]|nr:N-acetylmuramoyl-L-alanine amidase [Candidatus Saccharimonadales bacterium]